jgi:hypothetical protein
MSVSTRTTSIKQEGASPGKAAVSRRPPGTTGIGRYFHIQLRPSSEFVSYRTHDVGRRGHIQRVAGKRPTGSWATIKWLVAKEDAHLEGEKLVADSPAARSLIARLGSKPVHTYGDRFSAKPNAKSKRANKPLSRSGRKRAVSAGKPRSGRGKT